MNSRKIYVDIFKAIAIILVVIGHTSSPLNPYLYLFHVPAFFFISGYVAKLNENSSLFLPKRFLGLLTPFVISNILFVLIIISLKLFDFGSLFYPYNVGIESIKSFLVNMLSPTDLGGATWFVFVLFEVSIIAHIMIKLNEHFRLKTWVILSFLSVLFIAVHMHYKDGHVLPYELDLAIRGLFYYLFGYYISQKDFFKKYVNPLYAIPLAVVIIIFYGKFFFQPMNWPTRNFSPNPFHNILTSFCGIYLVYICSCILERIQGINEVLVYIGKRTMIIVIFHFLAFKISYVIFYYLKIVPIVQLMELVPPIGNSYWVFLTILSIGICLFMDLLISKTTYPNGLLLGKWSREKQNEIIHLFIERETR